jgi:hypothetical protein
MTEDPRLYAPATLRNRDPILAALRGLLPSSGLVLEIASGTGEHVAHFGAALPGLAFQPTEPSATGRASIDAWAAGLPNIRPAIALDVTAAPWPVGAADAVLCSNMIHIAPWAATLGLLRCAAAVLPAGAPLILYGPFRIGGAHTAPSNAEFDAGLRAQDPAWGVRDLEAVAAAAAGFAAPEVISMPANNLIVVFRKTE